MVRIRPYKPTSQLDGAEAANLMSYNAAANTIMGKSAERGQRGKVPGCRSDSMLVSKQFFIMVEWVTPKNIMWSA